MPPLPHLLPLILLLLCVATVNAGRPAPPLIRLIVNGVAHTMPRDASDLRVARFCYANRLPYYECARLAAARDAPFAGKIATTTTTTSEAQDNMGETGYSLVVETVAADGNVVPRAMRRGQGALEVELGWNLRISAAAAATTHSQTQQVACLRFVLRSTIGTEHSLCQPLPFTTAMAVDEERSHLFLLTAQDDDGHDGHRPLAAAFVRVLPPSPTSGVLDNVRLRGHAAHDLEDSVLWWFCTAAQVYGAHWSHQGSHHTLLEPPCDRLAAYDLYGLHTTPFSALETLDTDADMDADPDWCTFFKTRAAILHAITTQPAETTKTGVQPPYRLAEILAQKLRHDADQFDFILQPPRFRSSLFANKTVATAAAAATNDVARRILQTLISDYRVLTQALLSSLSSPSSSPVDCQNIGPAIINDAMDASAQRRFRAAFNAILVPTHTVLTSRSRQLGAAVRAAEDAKQRDAYHNGRAVVVDGVLTAEALADVREVLRTATVWNDIRPGFLGTYFDDRSGMAHPVLVRIAQELASKFPGIICGRPVHSIWAYKYDARYQAKAGIRGNVSRSGIHLHADAAAVNANIWVTEDEASLDKSSGGMVIFEGVPVGEGVPFSRFNSDPQFARDWLQSEPQASRVRRVVVPHRANRMVVFDSQLFHETDHMWFREGYKNRRINLTFLFGNYGQPCVETHF